MDGWMDGWVDGWLSGWVSGWPGGWMREWMDEGWMDHWVDGGREEARRRANSALCLRYTRGQTQSFTSLFTNTLKSGCYRELILHLRSSEK